jgi:hypothetical protein
MAEDFVAGVVAAAATRLDCVNGFSPAVTGVVADTIRVTQIRGSVKDRLLMTGAWRKTMSTIP